MIADQIQQAIENGSTIEIAYTKFDGTSSIRTLSGIEYSESYGTTHISAFCNTRHEQRTFKISRISCLKVVNTTPSNDTSAQNRCPNTPYVFNPNKKIFNLDDEKV